MEKCLVVKLLMSNEKQNAFEKNNNQGFSLLELVVILTIISFLTFIYIPSLGKTIEKQNLINAARIMTVNLREARQLAISEERNITVLFRRQRVPQEPNSYVIRYGPTETYKKIFIKSGISLVKTTFTLETLTFNTIGNCNAGTVILETPNGGKMYVIVDSVGRVRTSDVPPL
ncbi:prepilin-type N-terminal cleavage/methylation domain-containing protein [Bacillota bacterium LX-D]|nr:prepilin-type N-terminal cleavage/methylation domain-containing protein [Bacillota bacterium LX-D]